MAVKQDILQLSFKEDISLGFQLIPINDHYARTQSNLRQPHRALAKTYYQKIITDYPGSLWINEARERFRLLRGDKPDSSS